MNAISKFSLTAMLALLPLLSSAETKKTNIIYILADDLGWTDTGTYGSRFYETPNIDNLVVRGMKMTRYHNCQNCQPTRAAVMSGQYGPRTGVYTVGSIDRFNWKSRPLRPVDNVTSLPLEKITIAQSLKKAGYATAMFGKWHLGEDQKHHPSARGFDEAIVSDGAHFNFKTNPEVPHPKDQYLADFLTDRAEDFIRRRKDGPFFLYLPHFGVHSPFQAKEEDKKRFEGKAAVGGHRDPTYAGMITAVDRSVGRIVALLDELKIAENTVVIFSSDNGGVGGYGAADGLIRDPAPVGQAEEKAIRKKGKAGGGDDDGGGDIKSITDNTPLRSGKGSLYEGGTRVPFIVSWPGVVKPGTTSEEPSIHVDLYPTFLDIAGAARPDDYILDGESLMPVLKDAASSLKRPAIYQHFPGYLGSGPGMWRTTPVGTIQAGDWKLMEYFEDNRLELYNLKDDVGEKTNLATTNEEKAKELRTMLTSWREQVGARMPTPNTVGKADKKADRK